MTRALVPVLLLLGSPLTLGCFSGDVPAASTGIDDDFMDDQPPPGDCPGTGCPSMDTGGSPLGGACSNTNDCASGLCVADFDGEVQSFTCQSTCVPLMDESQWCADDPSCCAGAVCSARGFCVPIGETEGLDSGDSGTGIGSSSTGSSSETGDTGNTDTGSGSTGSGSTSSGSTS